MRLEIRLLMFSSDYVYRHFYSLFENGTRTQHDGKYVFIHKELVFLHTYVEIIFSMLKDVPLFEACVKTQSEPHKNRVIHRVIPQKCG